LKYLGSELTNGYEKYLTHVTIYNYSVISGVTHYILSSPLKVKDINGNFLYVIFAKENPLAVGYKTFRKLLSTIWFSYMNKFSSGRIYNFQIQTLDFDFSQSLGYKDRLYSPVSIHYNLVDDCTDVEAVRN